MSLDSLLLFNAWLSVIMFGLTTAAITSPRIKDGVVIKAGLILMNLGYLGCASTLIEGISRHLIISSWVLTNVGLLIALAGWLLQGVLAPPGPRRRQADILHSTLQGLS